MTDRIRILETGLKKGTNGNGPIKKSAKLIVIGGGAAGFFCAINAARRCPEMQVSLVEKSNKLLSKVKVSGGGRCNVTHACFDVGDLIKNYPRGKNFLRKSLPQFMPQDTIQWFEERKVRLKTESDGRMFPVTDQSQTIVDCLMLEAKKQRVDIRTGHGVSGLSNTGKRWRITYSKQPAEEADYVCIACGGFPKAQQFDWLQKLHFTITPPAPSLFTFNLPGHPIRSLQGISLQEAKVKIQGIKLQETGPLLITHWGFSGPVVLRLSAWGARRMQEQNYHFTIQINWLPGLGETGLREAIQAIRSQDGPRFVFQRNPFKLPKRLWEFLLQQSNIEEKCRWAELPAKAQNQLIELLNHYAFEVKGKTTFKDEFVTCGGIELSEIDPRDMQSRRCPGLFFAGEIMDIDGITGGFNFQHAWNSGWIAAKGIAEDLNRMIE